MARNHSFYMYIFETSCVFLVDSSTKIKICFSFVRISNAYKFHLVTIANRVINKETKERKKEFKLQRRRHFYSAYYSFLFVSDFHGQNHLNVNALHIFSHSLFILSLGFFPTKKESRTTTFSLSTNDHQHQRHH